MQILPVLDIKDGLVVRGVAGKREVYRPIESALLRRTAETGSEVFFASEPRGVAPVEAASPTRQPRKRLPTPAVVAEAFFSSFGLREFYLADLDAIEGRPPAWEIYAELLAAGYSLWIDAGARDAKGCREMAAFRAGSEQRDAAFGRNVEEPSCGVHADWKTPSPYPSPPKTGERGLEEGASPAVSRIIAGLETVAGPEELAEMLAAAGPERLVFSLDLKAGRPLTDSPKWPTAPWQIAREAIQLGVRTMIVLDLARVGTGGGVHTLELCRQIREMDGSLSLIAGGGVRHAGDLRELAAAGCDGALVASALHDGAISADEVRPAAERR